ncbi:permease prefix domain 1-containing protein [Streptomyces sp. NBC_01463]|uniref:permease prefix domain 1-containing protein n=1 Tax=Streptomyces sp. NBC_01104 TaxID=2903750 RepID=UPI00324E3617|nr:permease prefix domain 1-containing protein [Streptomyces sp. NBC_01104]
MKASEPPAGDPVETHLADLAARLHGPARLKARMVDELREGLLDAARELSPDAEPGREAARRAIREFGTVAELAPSFQYELTVTQARHTARTVMLIVPCLLVCWSLVELSTRVEGHGLPGSLQVAVAHLGGLSALTALPAAVFLSATGSLGRRLRLPQRLPLVVAWSGTAAAVALGLSALTLVAAAVIAGDWPLTAAACLIVIALHARVATSARVCRRCARLPVTAP